jgi:hypothetical protein
MKSKIVHKAVTPVGTATWVNIETPDTSKLGKNKYKCGLMMPKGVADVEALVALLKDEHKKAGGKGSRSPVKDGDAMAEEDAEKYERFRGSYVITAKSKAKPGVVGPRGGAGQQLQQAPGSGDLIRLAIAVGTYQGDEGDGVTLYLNGVQVLERRAMVGTTAFDDLSSTYQDVADTPSTQFEEGAELTIYNGDF